MIEASHPVLSGEETATLEAARFRGDEDREWPAMVRAGRGVGGAVLRDLAEIGGLPPEGRILAVVGKGHNGGDALLAAETLLRAVPGAGVEVVFAAPQPSLRPLTARAWRQLVHAAPGRVTLRRRIPGDGARWDVLLDGLFGYRFRPPVDTPTRAVIEACNAAPVRLRAAVDLPSGLGGDAVIRADFTYATGVVKTPLVDSSHAAQVGRLRYVDLGFFDEAPGESRLRILTPAVLDGLRGLRDPQSDKRSHGHLLVVGGSRSYPGAILMTVLGALRSGVGLVTAFVPESLAPAFAARAPAAMWVGWPETPAGGLALEGRHLLLERLERATALVVGPGLTQEDETLALASDLVGTAGLPLLLDADALQPAIVRAGKAPRILTPHLGEFRRILAGGDFHENPGSRDAVVLLKGRLTGITQKNAGYFSPHGGPVLARGGSGDILAGVTGGLLAQRPADPLLAACRGAVWHGMAADLLARAKGQVAVETTDLLEYLAPALVFPATSNK